MPTSPSTAAGQAGDDDIEDGHDAGYDGLEDRADAVNDGHEACPNGLEDRLDLKQRDYVSNVQVKNDRVLVPSQVFVKR